MGTQGTNYNNGLPGNLDFLFNDPILTEEETINKCQSVLRFKPASVWVKACYVSSVVALLRNEEIRIGTNIGCQDGSNNTQIKVAEAKRALTEGATLLATAVNVGFVREQWTDALLADLNSVAGIAHMNGAIMEVTLASALLERNEVLEAAQVTEKADVDILSLPIKWGEGGWDFSLYDLIRKEVGVSLQFKGLIQGKNAVDKQNFFDKGFDRVGVRDFNRLT